MRPRFIVAATVAVSLYSSLQSEAQDGTNVLVIANGANRASVQIAEEYVAARAVPNDQLLRLRSRTASNCPVPTSSSRFKAPSRPGWQHRVCRTASSTSS